MHGYGWVLLLAFSARQWKIARFNPDREADLAEEIRIEFTRFSAFYSPLIATFAAGFLQQEGLAPKHSVSAPGKSAIAGLADGADWPT